MTPTRARRRQCSTEDARIRLRQAKAFLDAAYLVWSETDRPEDLDFNHVAAGNAVLAAIAASDAICCRLLGERSRGQDHREAISLLQTVRFGTGDERILARRARQLAGALGDALDLKDQSHYGTSLLGPSEVRRLIRQTQKLVDAAAEVVGRVHKARSKSKWPL
jgi:hypothetical protein